MSHPLFARLPSFDHWTDEDVTGFSLFTGPKRALVKREALRLEGDLRPETYILITGWLLCSVNAPGGNRQITKVHLPGDLVGMPSFASGIAMETIEAITAAEVEIIPPEAFGKVFQSHPKLAAMLFVGAQEERVRLMHQLTTVGQHQAMRRIAAFLHSLYQRVHLGKCLETNSFTFPMTQVDLAEATGMTPVHVNRCLKVLRQQNILTISGGKLTLHDMDQLARLADMPALPSRSLDWV